MTEAHGEERMRRGPRSKTGEHGHERGASERGRAASQQSEKADRVLEIDASDPRGVGIGGGAGDPGGLMAARPMRPGKRPQ